VKEQFSKISAGAAGLIQDIYRAAMWNPVTIGMVGDVARLYSRR